ncbi:MAG TPA: FAD-dependent oxidoreductase, partial [Tepidisphaeraceae bacterium]|nr:FAD-dependent oxidoreductase [Tepidisphaeraceae bacterium]
METTGTERPVYVDRLPLCNIACPAGENIQEWLSLAQAKRYEEAWRSIVKNNPMPAIHGRVCYHPCENACNRKRVDEAVNIHGVERFLGDLAIANGWTIPTAAPTGKKVLVIGAGPCGLSAAYHLALMGHKVTVHEAGAKLGGMMRYGIPEYRLPRNVVDAEIDRIGKMGVEFKTNTKTENLDAFLKDGLFDAVFLAIGAQLSKRVEIPSQDAGRIIDALKFLSNPQENSMLCLGRRVAVYGGGNTAMDAARTALRLGAAESLIIYRRDQARMPAHQSELQEAEAEGVIVNWLRTIKEFSADRIEVEVMK